MITEDKNTEIFLIYVCFCNMFLLGSHIFLSFIVLKHLKSNLSIPRLSAHSHSLVQ